MNLFDKLKEWLQGKNNNEEKEKQSKPKQAQTQVPNNEVSDKINNTINTVRDRATEFKNFLSEKLKSNFQRSVLEERKKEQEEKNRNIAPIKNREIKLPIANSSTIGLYNNRNTNNTIKMSEADIEELKKKYNIKETNKKIDNKQQNKNNEALIDEIQKSNMNKSTKDIMTKEVKKKLPQLTKPVTEEEQEEIEKNAREKQKELSPIKTPLELPRAFSDNLDRFKDGYQFGDVTKTIAETVGDTVATAGATTFDIGANALKGIGSVGIGLANLGAGGVAQVADWVGQDDFAKKLRNSLISKGEDPISKEITKMQNKLDKYSASGKTLDQAAETAGYMATLWATGDIASSVGEASGVTDVTELASIAEKARNALIIGDTAGHTLSEVYKTHGADTNQLFAWTKAIGSGLIEEKVEKLGGFFGTSKIDNKIASKLLSKVENGIGKAIVNIGISANSEGMEEIASYVGNHFLDRAIDCLSNLTGNKVKYAQKRNWGEMSENYTSAFLSTLLTGGFGAAGNALGIATENNSSFAEGLNQYGYMSEQSILEENLTNDIDKLEKQLDKEKDENKKATIETKINDKKNQLNSLQQSSNVEQTDDKKAQLLKMLEEKEQERQVNNKAILPIKQNNNNPIAPIIQQVQNNTENVRKNINFPLPNTQNVTEQQYSLNEENTQATTQKPYSVDIKNDTLESTIQANRQYFKNEKDYNRIYRQSKAIQDITKAVNPNKAIKVLYDTSVDGDALITTEVDGQRAIIVNPTTNRSAEEAIVHELFHGIKGTEEFKEMSNALTDFASKFKIKDKNGNVITLDTVKENLRNRYESYYDKNNLDKSNLDIDEEANAFLLQTIIGDEKSLNRITKQHPKIIQKLYNMVDKISMRLKGVDKDTANMIVSLRNKLGQALKNNSLELKENNRTNIEKFFVENIDSFNDKEYNNLIDKHVSKKDYALICTILGEQNYSSGIKEFEAYNYEQKKYVKYTVYLKNQQEFKIADIEEIDKGVDDYDSYKYSISSVKRIEKPRSRQRDSKFSNEQIKNGRATGKNDRLYDINSKRENSQRDNNPSIGENKKKSIKNSEKSSFSLPEEAKIKRDVVETRKDGTLLALHNLTPDKLKKVLELKGFPMPSIAVTNKYNSNSSYGDISIVFNKNTINPENVENKVFSRDAYTPRVPKNINKINPKGLQEVAKKLNTSPSVLEANEFNEVSLDEATENIKWKYNLAEKYADENNIKYEKVYDNKIEKLPLFLKNAEIQDFIKKNDITLSKLATNSELSNELKELITKNFGNESEDAPEFLKYIRKDYAKTIDDLNERYHEYINNYGYTAEEIDNGTKFSNAFLEQYRDYFNTIKNPTKIINEYETTKNLKNVLKDNKNFDNFVKNFISPAFESKQYVRNNKNYYNEKSGNPRSFEQLYEEYNLDNVVKIMKELTSTGSESGFVVGISELAGNASKRFNSIDEIKQNENMLHSFSENEYSEMLDSYQKKIDELSEKAVKRKGNGFNYFMVKDGYVESLGNIARKMAEGKNLTVKNVMNDMEKDYFEITEIEAKEIINLLHELQNLPTEYFEAKPQRAVGLDEIKTVVLPKNLDANLKQQLKNIGARIIEYDSNIEGDREAKLKSEELDDLRFSKSDNKNKSDEFLKTIDKATGKKKRTYFTSETERINIDSKNFEKQIEAVQNGEFPKNDMLTLLSKTPQPLIDIGLNNYPITMTQKHLDAIMNKEGKYKNANYHNLGIDIVRQLPKAINNPLDIVESNTDKNSIVLTTYLADKEDRNIIASIKIDGKGQVNNIEINTNVATSVYGRNNYDKFMQSNLENGKLLYDIDRGVIKKVTMARLQLPRHSNSVDTVDNVSTNNIIIPQNKKNNNNLQNSNKKSFFKQIAPIAKNGNENKIKLPLPNKNEENIVKKKLPEAVIKKNAQIAKESNFESITNVRIVEKRKKKPTLKSFKEEIKKTGNEFYQKFVNHNHYLDKHAKATKNDNIKYQADKVLASSGIGQYNIGKAQTDINGNRIGKSIADLFTDIEKNQLSKEFSEYMYLRNNVAREAVNKPIFGDDISSGLSKKMYKQYEEKYPNFKQYAEEIYKYLDNENQLLIDAGLITKNQSDYLKELYPDYVPVERMIENSKIKTDDKTLTSGTGIKKATGGNSDIMTLQEAMAKRTMRLRRVIEYNNLMKEVAHSLKNSEVEVEELFDVGSPQVLFETDNSPIQIVDGKYQGIYYENGKAYKFELNKELYESLKGATKYDIEDSIPLRALQKASKVHRDFLTKYSTTFPVINAIKDLQDVALNSKNLKEFAKSYPKAIIEMKKDGKLWNQYLANGGGNNTYFDYQEGILPTNTKNPIKKIGRKIGEVNEFIEQLPRFTEYMATLNRGGTINEALYNAAEITTNFKRGGDITKAINRNGATFLNASVQGFDKFFRNFSEQKNARQWVALGAKIMAFGISPALINELIYGDDEDYQDLQNNDKDLYYLFKYDDGKFKRIPKGRMLSIFGTAAGRTLRAIKGEEDAFEGMLGTISNQIAPNNPVKDNVIAPIIQASTNKSWFEGEIVGSRLQKELPKNQYDENTSSLAIWLGQRLNMSPKKIDYVIDQYSGGVGDIILPMTEKAASNKGNVFLDKFTTDSVLKNRNVSKFYDTIDKQMQIANDPNSTEEDKVKLKYLTEKNDEISDLYKEKREVQLSDMKNKEKSEKVREIQNKINTKMKDALESYKDIKKIDKDIIKVKDSTYLKLEGKWKSLTEYDMKTIQMVKQLKGKEEDYYRYKIDNYKVETNEEKLKYISNNIKNSQSKKAIYGATVGKQDKDLARFEGSIDTYLKYKVGLNDAKDGKDKTLKVKEKIDVLLNSGFTNNEMRQLYESNILTEKDDLYPALKSSNINMKEYLKYKQQDFSANKKDDGTLKGKSISGTRKKKIYSYVNNMNITYEQRLLILGTQYKLHTSEQTKAATYINNLNISKEEKMDLYSKMKGFKVYKNGRVTW